MNRKVLIVEDDPHFAEFLEVTVRAAGHEPYVAHDGAAAMEAFRSIQPDLVFMDMLVPKKDGYRLCEEIRALDEGRLTPIVILTGIYKKPEYREDARRRFGVNDYLVKPVGIVDLWQVLGKHLEEGGEARRRRADEAEAAEEPGEGKDLFLGTPVSETPLAAVLQRLREGRKTGLLFLKDRSEVVLLYLEGGEVVFARSNDPGRRLSATLRRRDMVSEEDLRRAVSLMRKSSIETRMGEILVDMGCLSRRDMEGVLQEQLEDLVMEGFRRESWRVYFVEGDLPSQEPLHIERDTRNLVLKGIREIADLERVRRHLPGPGAVLARTAGEMGEGLGLDLTPYEEKMLSLCDGTRTLRKVLAIGRLAPVEMERLLYAFLNTGVVEVVGEVEGGEEAASGREGEARPPAGDAPLLDSGSVSRTALPAILMQAHRGKRSGVLEMERGGEKAWLYFDAGRLVFVGSNERRSRLGEILREGGLVSEDDLENAAAPDEDDGREVRMGQRLVEEGLLTLEELSWAMTFQMQKRLQGLFPWTEGAWSFRGGPFPTDETISLGFDTLDVVQEGLRRMDPDHARSCLPDTDAVLRCPPGAGQILLRLNLTTEEKTLLALIRDGASVGEVSRLPGMDGAFLARSLHAFLTFGLLEVEEPAQAAEIVVDEADRAMDGLLGDNGDGVPKRNDMVPRKLLEQSVTKQQVMQREMYEIYQKYEGLRDVISCLRDEMRTLRASSLMERLESGVSGSVKALLEEYLERLEKTSPPA